MSHQASEVWVGLLNDLLVGGRDSSPRKMLCKEIICHTTKVDMCYPIVRVEARDIGFHFMAAEAWWILTGQNRVKTIKKYAAIEQFSNDGFHFDGAYGPKVVDQLRYVADILCSDEWTRQSVMSIWRPNPRSSKDIPCTLTLQWLLRHQKLHCVANMRSSDAWLGWPYDVFNFTMITGYIMLLMQIRNPGIKLRLGDLYINVGAQHLYEKNNSTAQEIIDNELLSRDLVHEFDPLHYQNPDNFLEELQILKDHPQGAIGI